MILEQLIQKMEARVFDLGRHFWCGDPAGELEEQAEALCDKLQRQHAALHENRARVEELRTRLLHQEKRAAYLAARVQTYVHVGDQVKAWQHALELDQVRRGLHEDRPRLRQLILACRDHEGRVEHLERSLTAIQERLYQVRHGHTPRLRAQS